MTRRLTVYGHRGAAAELPENTLASFARALEVGADAIETDCHMTRDGVIVLAHDERGDRMAGEATEIRAEPWSRVRRWDAGRGFADGGGARPYEGKGYHPPTFAEALAAFPSVAFNVDAKQEEPNMIPALLRVIRGAGAEGRVRIASFSQKNLERVRAAAYEGETSLGPREVVALLALPAWLARRIVKGTAAQIPPRQGPVDLASPSLFERARRLGVRVDYWTIDEPARARELFERGASGVVTNDPRVIAPVARAFEARG